MAAQLYGPGVPTQYNNVQDYSNAQAAFRNGTGYQPTVANAALGGAGGTPLNTAPQGSGGGSAPTAPTAPTAPDPFQQALDSAFGAEQDYLNQAQSAVEGAQGGIISGINQNIDTSLQNINASHQGSSAQLDQSVQQGEQKKQDALVAARRLYNELLQGGQQRFGGASSAGEAYGALTGRELQRNTQGIESDSTAFQGQIATARNNLNIQYENGIRTLEQTRNDSLRQAERDYQDKLLAISHDRSMAAQNKANAQLSALQALRNNVYAINVAQAQNSNTLNTAKTQAEQQLAQYSQSLTQNMGTANTAATAYQPNTNPSTGLAINSTGGGQTFNPTGRTSPEQRKQDQFGFNFAQIAN